MNKHSRAYCSVSSSLLSLYMMFSLVLTLIDCVSLQAVDRDPPNVLFVAIDDLNDWAADLSPYVAAKTPHIDALASRGTLFANAHCAAPACNPSRASVMTGVRPSTSGVYYNWQDWRECSRLKDVVTLPECFKNHGYTVHGGGKLYHAASLSEWGHAGYLDPRPWDTYYPSKHQQLPREVKPATFPSNGSKQFYRGFFDWAPLSISDAQMADAQVVDWAQRQLSQVHEKPLFLAVGIYRPHIPWYTPETWFDEYPLESISLPKTVPDDLSDVPEAGQAMARRPWHAWIIENGKWKQAVQAYLASVSFADAMVGRLLDALDQGPHADNTIIVLWSDHGYHLGHKEHWEKFALWEQTTHVPLIVVDPRIERQARRSGRPTSLLDIYPTLVDLCGFRAMKHLEGQSLRGLLNVPSALPDRAVVTTQGPGNHAVRSQHWRYIRYADGSEELYDRQQDPHELINLATDSKYDTVCRQLALQLPKHDASLSPSEKTKRNPSSSVK